MVGILLSFFSISSFKVAVRAFSHNNNYIIVWYSFDFLKISVYQYFLTLQHVKLIKLLLFFLMRTSCCRGKWDFSPSNLVDWWELPIVIIRHASLYYRDLLTNSRTPNHSFKYQFLKYLKRPDQIPVLCASSLASDVHWRWEGVFWESLSLAEFMTFNIIWYQWS